MARVTAILFLLATIVHAQPGPVNPKPTNVDFSEGAPGGLPSGWTMPNTPAAAGYSAELRRENCPALSLACVLFQAPSTPDPDGPVNSQGPQWREVVGRVASDAKFVSIWARFHPLGPAWISEPVFGAVKTPTGSAADQDAIRTLIRDFANARNAHDGNAAAQLYSEDGAYGQCRVRGRAELAALWGSLPGHVKRTIQSISFPASSIASVSVATQYNEETGHHNETFIVVREADGVWRIRIHQSIN